MSVTVKFVVQSINAQVVSMAIVLLMVHAPAQVYQSSTIPPTNVSPATSLTAKNVIYLMSAHPVFLPLL